MYNYLKFGTIMQPILLIKKTLNMLVKLHFPYTNFIIYYNTVIAIYSMAIKSFNLDWR